MPDFKKRTSLVTFRLTHEEYEKVRRACLEQDVRSMSEFARRAVLNEVLRHGSLNVSFADDLTTLTLRLREVDAAVKDVGVRIAKLLGSESGTTPAEQEQSPQTETAKAKAAHSE